MHRSGPWPLLSRRACVSHAAGTCDCHPTSAGPRHAGETRPRARGLTQVSLDCLNPPNQEAPVSVRVAVAFALYALGCSGTSHRTESSDDYGFVAGGRAVWVRGPWTDIEPSRDVDVVIDQLCPAVMKLPRARERDYGQEYCGLIYSLGDGVFYASKGSPLGETQLVGASRRKSCFSPRRVVDVRGRTVPLADFHSHPWAPSPMSPKDREAISDGSSESSSRHHAISRS